MKRWAILLLAALLFTTAVGCGNEKDRGKNKNEDRPVKAKEEG